jgi:hypothetical protein
MTGSVIGIFDIINSEKILQTTVVEINFLGR